MLSSIFVFSTREKCRERKEMNFLFRSPLLSLFCVISLNPSSSTSLSLLFPLSLPISNSAQWPKERPQRRSLRPRRRQSTLRPPRPLLKRLLPPLRLLLGARSSLASSAKEEE